VWQEWIDNLALRRVYYFEHDHYVERMEELDSLLELKDPEDPFQQERPPWLPHPELRETIPNVSLYSVLYKLPKQFTTTDLPPEASDLDRQLAATVDFFDQCVPNQPGFSSSVAAATILPEAQHVSLAWTKWYRCGKKLRQLRFIRSHLDRRLREQEQEEEAEFIFVEAGQPPIVQASHTTEKQDAIVKNTNKVTTIDCSREPTETYLGGGSPEEANTESGIGGVIYGVQKSFNHREPASEESKAEVTYEVPSDQFDGRPDLKTTEPSQMLPKASMEAGKEGDPEGPVQSTKHAEINSVDTETSPFDSSGKDKETPGNLAGSGHGETTSNNKESALFDESGDTLPSQTSFAFRYDKFDMVEYARVVGLAEEAELDNLFSDFGIEQLSVYAREFAQG
jgi:hypothetical protein